VLVDKPFIGGQERPIGHAEIRRVSRVNHSTCLVMVASIILFTLLALK
jgi:hypothetical protein